MITKGGRLVFQDSLDTLRRVYTLVNLSFQERMVKRNPANALALIKQALAFRLQNPYLLSALHWMAGDLQVDLGDYGEGEKSLLRGLEMSAANNDASERLCELEMLRGDAPAALRRLESGRADSSQFWGFTSFGVHLFKGYLYLGSGLFGQAEAEFDRVRKQVEDVGAQGMATCELFRGNYSAALAALRGLEKLPLGNVDLRELRLLLGRALLLADSDLPRAEFLFDDISRNSLEHGHLAEVSACYLLARQGRAAEAGRTAREAFAKLRQRARGDFMTRLWLFYDAYVYGRTMELVGDLAEARRGYQASTAANPQAELAERSRQRLGRLRLR